MIADLMGDTIHAQTKFAHQIDSIDALCEDVLSPTSPQDGPNLKTLACPRMAMESKIWCIWVMIDHDSRCQHSGLAEFMEVCDRNPSTINFIKLAIRTCTLQQRTQKPGAFETKAQTWSNSSRASKSTTSFCRLQSHHGVRRRSEWLLWGSFFPDHLGFAECGVSPAPFPRLEASESCVGLDETGHFCFKQWWMDRRGPGSHECWKPAS